MLEYRCSMRVTQKREREREIKNAKELEKGARDDPGEEREREIKKEEREYTRVHAQLSPLKYTRATKPATSLFPTSFLESLLARFAIFLTPAGYHCRCYYCSSLLFTFHVPPASYIRRLHRGAPFLRETCSWQKIDREDRATGKSRALSISFPSILMLFVCALRPSYDDSFSCLIYLFIFFFLLYRYYEKMSETASTERIA